MKCVTSGLDKTWNLKLPRLNTLSCDDSFMTVIVNFNKVLSTRHFSEGLFNRVAVNSVRERFINFFIFDVRQITQQLMGII